MCFQRTCHNFLRRATKIYFSKIQDLKHNFVNKLELLNENYRKKSIKLPYNFTTNNKNNLINYLILDYLNPIKHGFEGYI
jgi:hypothetical protein